MNMVTKVLELSNQMQTLQFSRWCFGETSLVYERGED